LGAHHLFVGERARIVAFAAEGQQDVAEVSTALSSETKCNTPADLISAG